MKFGFEQNYEGIKPTTTWLYIYGYTVRTTCGCNGKDIIYAQVTKTEFYPAKSSKQKEQWVYIYIVATAGRSWLVV